MGLSAGNYRATLYVFDTNDNYSVHSWVDFCVNVENPLPNFTLKADKSTYKQSDTAHLSWSASTIYYDLHISYNGGSDTIYETTDTSYDLSNLSVGQYRITLYTLNDYGWTGGGSVTFSVIANHTCDKSSYEFLKPCTRITNATDVRFAVKFGVIPMNRRSLTLV